jgi:DNA polymerase III sliding clamp (beta) subunit (PCNA family)
MKELENYVLDSKDLMKIIKLVVDKKNPKRELNYLHYESKTQRLIATDTLSMLIVDCKIDHKEDLYIDVVASSRQLVCSNDDLKFPDYQRIIPQSYANSYDNIYRLLQDNSLNFPVLNKRLNSILSLIKSLYSISEVTYNAAGCLYCIEFKLNNVKCKLLFMGYTFNEKYDV